MENETRLSVQPDWCRKLSIQQQSVLFLAGRGPDGIAKNHPCKMVHVAYRGSVFIAAKYGRPLEWGEKADGFMSLDIFANDHIHPPVMPYTWEAAVKEFFRHHDDLPSHYRSHLMHGIEILGYKHPDNRFRTRWYHFYLEMVSDLHLKPESLEEMDKRLGDWDHRYW